MSKIFGEFQSSFTSYSYTFSQDSYGNNSSLYKFQVINNQLYVAGRYGVLKISNEGQTIEEINNSKGLCSYNGSTSYVHELAGDSDGNIYVAQNNGLAVSNNGGVSFSCISTNGALGAFSNISKVSVDSQGNLYVAVYDSVSYKVFRSTDHGSSFTQVLSASGISKIIMDESDNVFIQANYGVYVSSDGINFYFKNSSDGINYSRYSAPSTSLGNMVYFEGRLYNSGSSNGVFGVGSPAF